MCLTTAVADVSLHLSINMFKTSENFASAVRKNKLMFKTFIKIIYKNKS